jgi:hypothetical protein
LQAAANAGPEVSIGATGRSTGGGGLPSGMVIGKPCAAASTKAASLTDIAGPVDVDHGASCRRRRVDRQPADRLGDLVGGADPAERDVGDDLRSAAAGEVALWNKVRLPTTLKFLHLGQRASDPEIRALLTVLHRTWSSAPAAVGEPA